MNKFYFLFLISLGSFAQTQWKCRLPKANEGKNLIFYKEDIPLSISTCTPAQPGAISGVTFDCNTQGPFTYSIASVSGATAYVWTLPGGWMGSSTTNTISASAGLSGNITVAASNSCGTGPAQSLSVTMQQGPATTLTPYTSSICAGGSLTLTANSVGSPTYSWSTGSTSSTIVFNPTITTVYHLTATAANSCIAVLHRTISVYAIPNITATANQSLICAGEVATLTASGAANYNWNPSATGATVFVTPNVTTTYTITGTTQFGCSNTQTVIQNVSPCTNVKDLSMIGPKLFTYPNPVKDHLYFFVPRIGEDAELTVYNSLGQKIHSEIIPAEKSFSEHELFCTDKMEAGIYLLILENKLFKRSAKVVKE
jgi:hypothetical protein